MFQPDRDEVEKIIDQRISAAYARISGIEGVIANRTTGTGSFPTATTAVATGAGGTFATFTRTVQGSGLFRFQGFGVINALNTLQAVITPTVTYTIGGTDTTALTLEALALPGNTSTPSVGQLFLYTLSQTTLATFEPIVKGSTVQLVLNLAASVTGGSVPIGGFFCEFDEIF